MTHPANDLAELKQIIKNLTGQMATLINLVLALVNKNNQGCIIKDCSLEFFSLSWRYNPLWFVFCSTLAGL
jgi:hypothetical protein